MSLGSAKGVGIGSIQGTATPQHLCPGGCLRGLSVGVARQWRWLWGPTFLLDAAPGHDTPPHDVPSVQGTGGSCCTEIHSVPWPPCRRHCWLWTSQCYEVTMGHQKHRGCPHAHTLTPSLSPRSDRLWATTQWDLILGPQTPARMDETEVSSQGSSGSPRMRAHVQTWERRGKTAVGTGPEWGWDPFPSPLQRRACQQVSPLLRPCGTPLRYPATYSPTPASVCWPVQVLPQAASLTPRHCSQHWDATPLQAQLLEVGETGQQVWSTGRGGGRRHEEKRSRLVTERGGSPVDVGQGAEDSCSKGPGRTGLCGGSWGCKWKADKPEGCALVLGAPDQGTGMALELLRLHRCHGRWWWPGRGLGRWGRKAC